MTPHDTILAHHDAVLAPGGWLVAVELHVRSVGTVSVGASLLAPGPAFLKLARQRGLKVAVLAHDVGFYDDSLRPLADEWIACRTRDVDAVVQASLRLPGHVSAIQSSVDTFVGVAAQASAALGLRAPAAPSPALARDKAIARAALAAAGITDVRWGVLESLDGPLSSPIGYPCVAKPVDGAASWDVALVHDDRELAALAAQHKTRQYGRGVRPQRRLICEDYVEGPLWSAEGLVRASVPTVLAWSDRVMSEPPRFVELAITCSTEEPFAGAEAWVHRVLSALAYDQGPFHLEFIHSAEGPRLVELNCRLIGSGAHNCIEIASGVDPIAWALSDLLGLSRSDVDRLDQSATQAYITSPHTGTLAAVPDMVPIGEDPRIVSAEITVSAGETVRLAESSSDYLGFVVTRGTDRGAALSAAQEQIAKVSLDVAG